MARLSDDSILEAGNRNAKTGTRILLAFDSAMRRNSKRGPQLGRHEQFPVKSAKQESICVDCNS